MTKSSFEYDVKRAVVSIPKGKVVTYGQVAVMCGHPGAARQVGQIAHFGPSDLPWHRLVKADGSMASGFVPGGPTNQKNILLSEGINFSGDKVKMETHRL